MQQTGPEVEMSVSESTVYCRVRGSPGDSLDVVCNCAHNQWRWLAEREDVYAKYVDLNVVRPD